MIGITGLTDRLRPDSVIDFAGIRTLCFIYFELNPLAMDRIHPGKNYYNLRWIHLIEKLFG